MKPWADNQHIKDARILLLDVLISYERAETIFVIEPATHRHDRRVNIFKVRKNISFFPELIVVWVLHHLIPELEANPELFFIFIARVLQATHPQIKFVAICRPKGKALKIFGSRSWSRPRLTKAGEEGVVLRQKKRTVMVHVVAMKPVRYGRLR